MCILLVNSCSCICVVVVFLLHFLIFNFFFAVIWRITLKDSHVRCRRAGCWWVWVCRMIQSASSTALLSLASPGVHGCVQACADLPFQRRPSWKSGNCTGSACRRTERSPSWACSRTWDRVRTDVLETLETFACSHRTISSLQLSTNSWVYTTLYTVL